MPFFKYVSPFLLFFTAIFGDQPDFSVGQETSWELTVTLSQLFSILFFKPFVQTAFIWMGQEVED